MLPCQPRKTGSVFRASAAIRAPSRRSPPEEVAVNLRISLAVLGAAMLLGALALVPGASAQFCPPGQDYNPAGPDYCTTPPPPPTHRVCPKRKITGTNHDDKLIGSNKAERIFGRGGDDIIKARGGNDCLFGGT